MLLIAACARIDWSTAIFFLNFWAESGCLMDGGGASCGATSGGAGSIGGAAAMLRVTKLGARGAGLELDVAKCVVAVRSSHRCVNSTPSTNKNSVHARGAPRRAGTGTANGAAAGMLARTFMPECAGAYG